MNHKQKFVAFSVSQSRHLACIRQSGFRLRRNTGESGHPAREDSRT
jgi:hypothetical protein